MNNERLRSFVDPDTNEIHVSDFDLSSYLEWLEDRPVMGSKLLANFLHEWTHRWCFSSPVGNALALLRLRTGTNTLRGFPAQQDYVRCMTAAMLLEPFAEGLSLFAEFDTYPGKSTWQSQTLAASTLFFTPFVESAKPDVLLQGLLQTLRRDVNLLERKASIYARTGSDPYLFGYLSVKSLWVKMAAECEELYDRDLFLSYLRSYFYDDPELVVVLLREYPSELVAAEDIANYLLARVRRLVSADSLDNHVALWLKSAHNGKIDVSAIYASPSAEEESQHLLAKAIAENSEYDNSVAFIYMLLEERTICVLGSLMVRFRQLGRDQIEIISDQTNLVIKKIVEPKLRGFDAGELFVIATSDAHGLMFIISTFQQTILVTTLGRCPEDDVELARRLVANQPISRQFLATIRRGQSEDAELNLIWGLIKQRVDSSLKSMFGPLSTINVDAKVWERTFEELYEKGLHGLMGNDAELTRAVAAIGLLNTFTTEISAIRKFAAVLDIDGGSIDDVLRLEPPVGLPIVAQSKYSLMALV